MLQRSCGDDGIVLPLNKLIDDVFYQLISSFSSTLSSVGSEWEAHRSVQIYIMITVL